MYNLCPSTTTFASFLNLNVNDISLANDRGIPLIFAITVVEYGITYYKMRLNKIMTHNSLFFSFFFRSNVFSLFARHMKGKIFSSLCLKENMAKWEHSQKLPFYKQMYQQRVGELISYSVSRL